jgi:hypothetical protein
VLAEHADRSPNRPALSTPAAPERAAQVTANPLQLMGGEDVAAPMP